MPRIDEIHECCSRDVMSTQIRVSAAADINIRVGRIHSGRLPVSELEDNLYECNVFYVRQFRRATLNNKRFFLFSLHKIYHRLAVIFPI